MPIKPRNERGNRWLRYLLGAVLLALAVGGTAFAITWFLDDDGDPETPAVAQATATATVPAAGETSVTQTPETLAEPTATSAEPQPTATSAPVEPTQTSAPEADTGEADQQTQSAGQQDPGAASVSDATAYLPTVDDLAGVWAVQAEGDRPLEDVAAALGDGGADALAQFGWQENLFRDFNREAAPDETFFVSVSVHRFTDAAGAGEALTYFSDILALGGYQTASSVDIGDGSVALETSQDGYNLYALYVQDGNVMIRFGGSSQTGDPATFVNAVAEQVVDGA